jgi:hypothetical protein
VRVTDAMIRQHAIETLSAARGSLRIAADAVRGSIEPSAFDNQELEMLRRCAGEINDVADTFALFALAIHANSERRSEIETEPTPRTE